MKVIDPSWAKVKNTGNTLGQGIGLRTQTVIVDDRQSVEDDAILKSWEESIKPEAMELFREEAELTLKENPDDADAKQFVLQYADWKRRKEKTLTVTKKTQKHDPNAPKYGVWKRTEYGYLVYVTKARVDDIVLVKRKGGEVQRMRLIGEIAPNHYRAVAA